MSLLLDAMGQGVQTIQAANEGLETAGELLSQMKAVVEQAQNTEINLLAKVSTEEELLNAIESGKKGFIVIEGTINLSDNTSLKLADGQSLVGARYFDKNAAETTINFNFDGKIENGIEVGNNSIVSDLNINLVTNTRLGEGGVEKAVIYANQKKNVQFSNLNINTDTTAANEAKGFFSIELINSSGEITNNININTKGNNTRGIYATNESNLTIKNAAINAYAEGSGAYLLQSYKNSVINVMENSEINLQTSYQAVYIYNNGEINFYDNSRLNVMNGGIYGSQGTNVISFNDNSQINVKDSNTIFRLDVIIKDKAKVNLIGSVYNSRIYLQSKEAMLNIDAATPFSGTTYISAVSGAKFATRSGLYTALNNINEMLYNSTNLSQNFGLDAGQPVSIEQSISDMFDDFKTHMEANHIETQAAELKENDYQLSLYQKQFNEALSQYDMLINDSSYKGINLIKEGVLKINFNEDKSSNLLISGVNVTSENLGLEKAEWKTIQSVQNTLDKIQEAKEKLRAAASELGNYYSIITTREDFTNRLINVLEEGADKLTLADMNEESANMLSLQTQQLLAINSLSLSSQASQSILKLF